MDAWRLQNIQSVVRNKVNASQGVLRNVVCLTGVWSDSHTSSMFINVHFFHTTFFTLVWHIKHDNLFCTDYTLYICISTNKIHALKFKIVPLCAVCRLQSILSSQKHVGTKMFPFHFPILPPNTTTISTHHPGQSTMQNHAKLSAKASEHHWPGQEVVTSECNEWPVVRRPWQRNAKNAPLGKRA